MSSPDWNCSQIEPNPDISGIGVRSAIYAQAILTLVQPVLAGLDGDISKSEFITLHQLYLGILLPGCALVFSAIIQAKTHSLSLYHAMIVLNLSWINNASALIFFQFALIAQIKFDNERESRNKVLVMLKSFYEWLGSKSVEKSLGNSRGRKGTLKIAETEIEEMLSVLQSGLDHEVLWGSKETMLEVMQQLSKLVAAAKGKKHTKLITLARAELDRVPKDLPDRALRMEEVEVSRIRNSIVALLQRDWTMATLATAHLILLAAFGLWHWFKVDHSDICEQRVSIFVPNIIVTSRPLQYFSIAFYIISILPYINIAFFGSLEFAAIYWCRRFITLILPAPTSSSSNSTFSLKSPGRTELYQFVALTFLLQTFLITTTELTIHNNRHLLKDYSIEGDWTFGQTLAIALIILPLLQVWTEVRRKENVEIFKRWFNLM